MVKLPQPSDYEIEQQFMDFLRANSLSPVGSFSFVINGTIQRYRLQGDKGSDKSGAYCIYTDRDWPIGWAEDWHVGERIDWFYKTDGLNEEQKDYLHSDEFKQKVERAKVKWESQIKQKQDNAAGDARIRIETLPEAPENHPYLKRKHIYPYGVKVEGDNLAVPLRNIDGEIRSLQRILPSGEKRLFPEASTKGCFWSIGLDLLDEQPSLPILLGEGFATMAKVYELTAMPSVAGISCNGLKGVAQALKSKYPSKKIICLADNDSGRESSSGRNPGIEAANELVRLGLADAVVAPDFSSPEDGTDWDDYAILKGDEETEKLLKERIAWETMNEQERHEYDVRRLLSGVIHELDPSINLPPQEFIGGLFPRKFVSLLIAPPSTGKTIFMQKFVSDLSIGGSIFDGFADEEPPRVSLILAGEAGYELLIRRGASMKWPVNPSNVKILDQYEAELKDIPIMLDDADRWQNIVRLVEMYSPDIMFIDTFSSFHECDENKATEMKPLIKKMAALARDKNMAVVPVHHSRKRLAKERALSLNQDDVIGSSIINRLVGLIIGIEPMKEDEKLLLVRPLKSWFSSFMPFTYTLKEGLYGGTVVQTDLAPASVNNAKIAVWNYLTINFQLGEWFTRAQIILSEIEGNITERQVRSILSEFVKSGKLQRRGNTKISEYSITGK